MTSYPHSHFSIAAGIAQSPLDRLCAAIADNDMAAFERLLEHVEDINAENERALLACLEQDNFLMAKKLFLHGSVSTLLLYRLARQENHAHHAFRRAPSGKDTAELKELTRIRSLKNRLEAWKAAFKEEVLPLLTMDKLNTIEKNLQALRHDLDALMTPARSIIKKPAQE